MLSFSVLFAQSLHKATSLETCLLSFPFLGTSSCLTSVSESIGTQNYALKLLFFTLQTQYCLGPQVHIFQYQCFLTAGREQI